MIKSIKLLLYYRIVFCLISMSAYPALANAQIGDIGIKEYFIKYKVSGHDATPNDLRKKEIDLARLTKIHVSFYKRFHRLPTSTEVIPEDIQQEAEEAELLYKNLHASKMEASLLIAEQNGNFLYDSSLAVQKKQVDSLGQAKIIYDAKQESFITKMQRENRYRITDKVPAEVMTPMLVLPFRKNNEAVAKNLKQTSATEFTGDLLCFGVSHTKMAPYFCKAFIKGEQIADMIYPHEVRFVDGDILCEYKVVSYKRINDLLIPQEATKTFYQYLSDTKTIPIRTWHIELQEFGTKIDPVAFDWKSGMHGNIVVEENTKHSSVSYSFDDHHRMENERKMAFYKKDVNRKSSSKDAGSIALLASMILGAAGWYIWFRSRKLSDV